MFILVLYRLLLAARRSTAYFLLILYNIYIFFLSIHRVHKRKTDFNKTRRFRNKEWEIVFSVRAWLKWLISEKETWSRCAGEDEGAAVYTFFPSQPPHVTAFVGLIQYFLYFPTPPPPLPLCTNKNKIVW